MRTQKNKNRTARAKTIPILLAGLSFGFVIPALPARAADVQLEQVSKDKVPAAAMRTFDKYLPPGSKIIEYVRQDRDGKFVYAANFKTADGRKLRLHVRPDGSLFKPEEVAEITGQPAGQPVAPLPAPEVGQPLSPAVQPALTLEQARAEQARLTAEEQRLRSESDRLTALVDQEVARYNQLNPAAQAGDRSAIDEQKRLQLARDTQVRDREQLATQIAQIQQRQRELATYAGAAAPAPLANAPDIGSAANDRSDQDQNVHYAQITAADVPAPAKRELDRLSANGRDLRYRQEVIDGKTSYSVHYVNAENRRYWASVMPNGAVRIEPRVSIYQPEAAPAAATPTVAQDKNPHYTAIARDQVPAGVARELDKYTKGAHDLNYRRELQGDKVSYSAFYLTPEDKRYWVSVNDNGTLKSEPRLSVSQPDEARTASGREPAGAAPRTGDAVQYTRIGFNDIPNAVRDDVSRQTKGAKDVEYLRSTRDGRTFYSAIWTGKDNKKMEARFDEAGKLVDGPHAAK